MHSSERFACWPISTNLTNSQSMPMHSNQLLLQASITCDLYSIGDTILPVNLAFAFPPETPDDYIVKIDVSLSHLEDTGVTVSGREWQGLI